MLVHDYVWRCTVSAACPRYPHAYSTLAAPRSVLGRYSRKGGLALIRFTVLVCSHVLTRALGRYSLCVYITLLLCFCVFLSDTNGIELYRNCAELPIITEVVP